ncbi:glycosyltransferase family 1 protein [Ornithinimicrobium ciconiae]|uniref:glycogen phosphorylase n=1 Tax=Ornithinimicrobium ciconiae TaxID=2594265 RepID=A0A516GDP6_9MICO|nr:alpha-glucan family phosphorylase [Ornithinimicrobium ciconiae]QDO89642.1 glycosyltransferase family 1 protein [Ornithinimicrobium ciconiae]
MKAIRRLHVRTVLPDALSPLHDLALNLRWSWHPPTLDLFESIDPVKWQECRRQPMAMLSSLTPADLTRLEGDAGFVQRAREAGEGLQRYLSEPRWYQREAQAAAGDDFSQAFAYFSPEFGLTAALPQYSGGLGILAGDHLKSASDLGVPIVGIGLFYKSGYFRQRLNAEGWQQESYPVLDPDDLPLSLLREADGSPAVLSLAMPGGAHLDAHVWRAQVGRVPLLLLDSDVETNDASRRDLTDRLYGGGGDQRLQQEMLLGIGGVRALRLWSRLTGAPEPDVYHMNEGHAGFQGLERISELTQAADLTFEEALRAVRASTVFTTHTPVPAGIDRFGINQIGQHFGGAAELPGVPLTKLLELGAETYRGGDTGVFNMAVMGLRLGQRANGVSVLHGAVSRGMFKGLWPGFDESEVPIGSITNGVHAGTWVDRKVFDLATEFMGPHAIQDGTAFSSVDQVPTDRIWSTKREMREQLVAETRTRLRKSMRDRGATSAELGWIDDVLDPDVLTIGFARRVPTYKRLTLMLRDPERLAKILLDEERPVQLVIAGKAHPADDTGKRLIQEMVRFTDDPKLRHRIVFLPNYDIAMAQRLYPGCDVWLNNPLRPFEACGTSGMKAALNGALNLSILDGWWDEWFDGENGWAIPTADGVDDERRDELEASALYDLLENNVVPTFYDRDEAGLPTRWLEMLTHTLGTLGPKVMADRMVQDYTQSLYLPAARAGRAVAQRNFEGARDLAERVARLRQAWPSVRVEHVEAEGVSDTPQVGETVRVRAYLALGGLSPEEVTVQVAFGRASESDELTEVETSVLEPVESYEGGKHRFDGELALTRTGSLGWTVRVLPAHPLLASDAELGLVANA